MGETSECSAEIDKRVAHRLVFSVLVFFPLVAAINASSLVSEAGRADAAIDWRVPWALEYTSLLAMAVPVLFAIRLERRYPVAETGAFVLVVILLAGSLVFSALHITGMAALRNVLIPMLTGEEYRLIANPFHDILYEYRKDLFPYSVIIALLTLYRRIWGKVDDDRHLKQPVAPTDRLELRLGGSIIRLDPRTIQWAEAAGNYVELRTDGRTHLARITMAELERRLRDAGIDVARVHKSYIVNLDAISEISPNGDGDLHIRLTDGSVIKGSRRYRHRLGA